MLVVTGRARQAEGVLTALLATLLVAAPPPPPGPVCANIPVVGPSAAPVQVRWFFDPVLGGNLNLWFALRRLIGDLDGEVALAPIIVASPTHRSAGEERVRAWFAAAACQQRAEDALRLIAREGTARVSRWLADPEGQELLRSALGVSTEGLRRRDLDALIERGSDEFRARLKSSSGRVGRPPAFAVTGSGAFEDGARLEAVRRAIEESRRQVERTRSTAAISRKGVSQHLVRPPSSAGMLIGGVALPHRVVILAEQEDHPDFLLLSAAIELRRRYPGWFAIHVIARGQTRAADDLRRRLCAATKLGLQLDYLRVLTRSASAEAADALRAKLDESGDEASCSPTTEDEDALSGGSLALPSGLWLDGAVLGQRELARLEREILQIEATTRPLDAVFSAATPPDP